MKSEKAMRAVGLLRKTKLSLRAIAAKSGLSLARVQQLNTEHGIRRPKPKTRWENALQNLSAEQIISIAQRRLNEIDGAALLAALRKRERESKKKRD